MFCLAPVSLILAAVSPGSAAAAFVAQVPTVKPASLSPRFAESTSKQNPVGGLLQTLLGLLSSILPKPGEPGHALEEAHGSPYEAILNQALEQAEAKVSSALKEATGTDKINNSLLLLAEERLKKFWYIGQCRRDYSAVCPLDWVEAEEPKGLCIPPETYEGPCRSSVLLSAPALQKEDFAWRCRAQWPCLGSPPRDLNANCPDTWAFIKGGVCTAPFNYRGPCSPFMDFSGHSPEDKLRWAGECDAPWAAAAAPKKAAGGPLLGRVRQRRPLGGPLREDGTLQPVPR